MPDIDDFLTQLASKEPVPGGGSVAGFEIAMGAALIVMVCDLTLGREKFAAVQAEVQTIRNAARVLQARARRLVDEDVEAFSAVATAMKLPRATDKEKEARRGAMLEALKGAVKPPLESMQAAHDAMELAVRLAPIGNPSAISDVGSGALALYAGYQAAKLNVEINLASIRDPDFVKRIRKRMPDDRDMDRGQTETVRMVLDSIRGGS